MRTLVIFLAGLLFGAGLIVSGMANPAKVLGFLDVAAIATGTWDPSLAFVMAGALAVTVPGYRLALANEPWFNPSVALPDTRRIDLRLVAGAAVFGIGRGLAGVCPGPAVVAAVLKPAFGGPFLAAMLMAMLIHDRILKVRLVADTARG